MTDGGSRPQSPSTSLSLPYPTSPNGSNPNHSQRPASSKNQPHHHRRRHAYRSLLCCVPGSLSYFHLFVNTLCFPKKGLCTLIMCFLAPCLNGLIHFCLFSLFHYMKHRISGSYLFIPVQTLHSPMAQPVKNLLAVQDTKEV